MDLLTLLNVADDIGWFVAPVTGWLLVAGEQGVTAEELAEAVGDVGEVRDALAMLNSHGCLNQVQDEPPKFTLKVQGYDTRGPGWVRGLPSRIAGNPESLKSGKPDSNIGGIGTARKMKKIRTRKPGPGKPKQSPDSLATVPTSRPVKRKKIKRTNLETFRTMVAEDSKRIQGKGSGKRYLDTPSEYPILNQWKHTDNPNHWKALDWVGYWLNLYLKHYECEDPIFKGQRCHPPRTETDIYWEHGFQAIQLRDSNRGFRGDGTGLKEYLDWMFTDFLPDATWMNDPIMAKQAFRVRSNSFLDKFKVRSVKVKGRSSRPRGKWNPWGWTKD